MIVDGPQAQDDTDRRVGPERRSMFRRAVDQLRLTEREPVFACCTSGRHAECEIFCLHCGVPCACACHGI